MLVTSTREMLRLVALPALRRCAPPARRARLRLRFSSGSCAALPGAPAASSRASPGAAEAPGAPETPAEATLALLERSIAQRQSARALALFAQLERPPSTTLLQKLAVLLAKQPARAHSSRAFDILLSVYRIAGFQPDDYTRLASIHVIESCLRHRQLDRAMELYDEAFNLGVSLDLSAYDALLSALVENGRVDEAAEILQDIAGHKDANPNEHAYLPVLVSLVQDREYHRALELLKQGEERGVPFTSETFAPLVEIAETDEDATDALVTFLSYIEDSWEEAKLIDEMVAGMNDSDDDNQMN